MGLKCDLAVKFGTSGNSLAYLGGGWARSEPEFTWCLGAESHIMLPRLEPAENYIITLDVVPFVHAPEIKSQRLIVSVNDAVVGSSSLFRPTLLAYRIPPSMLRSSDRVLITLQHPDAARPRDLGGNGDDRELSFSVSECRVFRVTNGPDGSLKLPPGLMLGPGKEHTHGGCHLAIEEWARRRTGLTVPQLAMCFESLGENCEFGLFQRRCDCEPLGLLRFSSTFLRNLIRGIDNGFEGLGAVEDIDPRLEGEERREFMIHEKDSASCIIPSSMKGSAASG